jgi:hypothetical protein
MATGDNDNDNGNGAMGAQQATTTMMIGTSKDNDGNDGYGAMGDEVNDDGNGVTGDGATRYGDNNDNGSALLATKLTIMA